MSEKIASLSSQEPQPEGTTKGATRLRFGKILGTPSAVRSTQNPQNVVSCKIHERHFIIYQLQPWPVGDKNTTVVTSVFPQRPHIQVLYGTVCS